MMEEIVTGLTTQKNGLSYYPKTIYKYRDWENDYHKRIIIDKEIYFPCFSELNDEFDGKQPFRFDTDKILLKDYKKKLKSDNGYEYNQLSKKEINQKYRDFKSGKDWKNNYEDHIDFVNKIYGVHSFAKTDNNQQLWANYANNNYGFCIGFDLENLYNSVSGFDESMTLEMGIDIEAIANENNLEISDFQDEFKGIIGYVQYDDAPILITFNNKNNVYEYYNLFFTKKRNWKYEDEIRILKIFASKKVFKLNENSISEIIFGTRTSQEHKNEIIKSVNSNFKNVDFFKIERNIVHSTFEVKPYKQEQ